MLSIDVGSDWFNQLVAQLAHFAWGALIALIPFVLWRSRWLGPGLVVAWALPKEFWFDVRFEHQTLRDGAVDFSLYALGLALGLTLMIFSA